jgi:hypothetical protein
MNNFEEFIFYKNTFIIDIYINQNKIIIKKYIIIYNLCSINITEALKFMLNSSLIYPELL